MSGERTSSASSNSSSSYCKCSDNEESNSCKCESENEDENIISFQQYWENNNEQSDVNREDIIMKAALKLNLASSDSEESVKRCFSDEDQTDSVTEVSTNTTPSHLPIPPSDYDKPCLSGYYVPEKFTKAKVRTFKKTGERNFKIEASSAINRRKKQFEIDRQNMIMLRKLRDVKPVVVLPR